MQKSCPGSRVVQEPTPQYVVCPHCRNEVEVWTDEYRARCERCHAWVYREQGATCLDWCAQAERCVGASALTAYKQARRQS